MTDAAFPDVFAWIEDGQREVISRQAMRRVREIRCALRALKAR